MTATASAFSHEPYANPSLSAPTWLEPRADQPRLRLIEGAGLVDVPSRAVDPMIEVYRRRRFVAAVMLTIIIVAAAQAFGVSLTSFGPTATESDESTPLVHVVQPGDTYAGIAATLGADDPVQSAGQLRDANGTAELIVGQRLVIDRARLAGAG